MYNLCMTQLRSEGSSWDEIDFEFLKEAVNGASLQSVLTRPPLVAQSSAFHRLEYILIAWFLGNGTPFDSMFLNSLIGLPSTEKLK